MIIMRVSCTLGQGIWAGRAEVSDLLGHQVVGASCQLSPKSS